MILMARQRLLLKPLASAARWLPRQGLLLKQLASASRWLSRQGLLLALWPWFSEQGRSLPSSAISDCYLPLQKDAEEVHAA